jgi:hypothetical protein
MDALEDILVGDEGLGDGVEEIVLRGTTENL